MRSLVIAFAMLAAPAVHAQEWDLYGGFRAGVLSGGYRDEFNLNIDYQGGSYGAFGGAKAQLFGPLWLGAELDFVGYSAAERQKQFGTDTSILWKGSALSTASFEVGPIAPFVAAGLSLAAQRVQPNGPGFGTDTQNHFGISAAVGIDISLIGGVFARVKASTTQYISQATYNLGAGTFSATMAPTNEISVGAGFRF